MTLATAAFGGSHGDGPVKAGFIFVGPIGDGGWTYEHNHARLAVEEAFVELGRKGGFAFGAELDALLDDSDACHILEQSWWGEVGLA